MHVCRSTGSVDRQPLRSTDCMTLALGLCRSTGSSGFSFLNYPTVDRAVDRSQRLFAKWRAGRPADIQTGINGSILDLFCFLWVPTAISCFQVVKLTPNDLVSLMNGIYPLPINRGHGSLVFKKKNIHVSSVSREEVFHCFPFSKFF